MAAEANLIKTEDLARVREVDFVTLFNGSITKLMEALGVTRKVAKQDGTTLKTYKATGKLANGVVAEGDTIPLSKYTTVAKNWEEIHLLTWRKAASAQSIIDKGFDQAVDMTTAEMLKDVQKSIKKKFFDFMGTGTATATGTGLQAALANGWGKLQVLFEDDDVSTVYFLNPEDISEYLGKAQVTMQTAFGMRYIEDFLGLGRVFMNSSVPKGKYYATPQDNIILYYVPADSADLGQAFKFTTDETGYIGIHEHADYTNLTFQQTVVNGMVLMAERLDGVVVGTITAAAAAGAQS